MEQVPDTVCFSFHKRLRKKLLWGFWLGLAIGVALLFWAWQLPRGLGYGHILTNLLGLLIIIAAFFSLYSLFKLRKDRYKAVYIGPEGITDFSSGSKYGLVSWEDILKIKIMENISDMKYPFIVLEVRNPDEYISREPSYSKRRSMKLKRNFYGSPICISSRYLDCSFHQLRDAIFKQHQKYSSGHFVH